MSAVAALPGFESEMSRPEIAAFWGLAEGKSGLRTVDRCNAIGRLPEVNCMPPWGNPPAFAEWYRVHYRSDPTKPARPSPKDKLPRWILDTLERHAGTGSGDVATPLPAPSEMPAAFGEDPLPSGGGALAVARAMLVQAERHFREVERDPVRAPAARRAYLETLEKVQQAEKRARDSGDTERELRKIVDDKLERIHRRLPDHLAQELAALRVEVQAAAGDPAAWAVWCREFFRAVGERLVRLQFQTFDS